MVSVGGERLVQLNSVSSGTDPAGSTSVKHSSDASAAFVVTVVKTVRLEAAKDPREGSSLRELQPAKTLLWTGPTAEPSHPGDARHGPAADNRACRQATCRSLRSRRRRRQGHNGSPRQARFRPTMAGHRPVSRPDPTRTRTQTAPTTHCASRHSSSGAELVSGHRVGSSSGSPFSTRRLIAVIRHVDPQPATRESSRSPTTKTLAGLRNQR